VSNVLYGLKTLTSLRMRQWRYRSTILDFDIRVASITSRLLYPLERRIGGHQRYESLAPSVNRTPAGPSLVLSHTDWAIYTARRENWFKSF
jgi:hypothetical protein